MRYIILFLFPLLLFANNLENSFEYFEDKQNLSLKQIQTKPFIPIKNHYLNREFTKNNIWVKISIKNPTNKNLQKVLYLDNPIIDKVEFYNQTTQLKNNQIDTLYYAFNLYIQKNSTNTYYLKLRSRSTLTSYIIIDDQAEYLNYIEKKTNFLIFIFSFILAIIIYNLFLFIILQEKAYLYYIAFQISTLLLLSSLSGLNLYLFWKGNHFLNEWIMRVTDDISIVFGLLFISQFLNIKQHSSKLQNLIYIMIILLLYCIVPAWPNAFTKTIMFSALILVFATSIYGVYKKIPNAKLFLFGWFILLLGSILALLKVFGIIENSFITTWSLYIGAMLEAIIFSIALANKINTIKQEKENILLTMQQTLQDKVNLKTKELSSSLQQREVLLKELNHRTKNNLQIVSSFINILLLKESDTRVRANYSELNDRLNSISLVHKLFTEQKDLQQIITQEYINKLVHNLSYLIHKEKKIKFNIEVCDTKLSVDQITTIGLILNELITNSLKYAFISQDKGTITIQLSYKDNLFKFIYKDNGIGFNFEEKSKTSFGLQLIKRLSTKQLNANFNFVNEKKYILSFKAQEETYET